MQLLYEPRAAVDPAAATGKKELVKTASEPVKKKRKFAGKFGPQVRTKTAYIHIFEFFLNKYYFF